MICFDFTHLFLSTSDDDDAAADGGEGRVSLEVSSLIKAIADGYPFATTLDRRPPAPNGLAPESEQDVLWRGFGGALVKGESCE